MNQAALNRKPSLAIVANAPSPYRLHQHLRIARELGDEIEFWSLFLQDNNLQPWQAKLPEEIRPVRFGEGESMEGKTRGSAMLRQWSKMGRVTRWLAEHNIDVVISTGYNDLGLMRLIAWCRRKGVPNYMFSDSNVYGDQATGLGRFIKDRYVRWVVRSLTGLLPCGTCGKQYYENYGGAGEPLFYMPHEPDYQSIFQVSADQRTQAQLKFHLDDNRRYILYSGRLVKVKGVETLIDAYAKIAAERPNWDLLIVGDGELRDQLKARVPEELSKRVVWAGFIDDASLLGQLYTCGDIFVLPSLYEPWAVVVCEAAAAGLPLVCSNVVGAAHELCREGVNGAMFPPSDVPALSQTLLDLTGNERKLDAYRRGSLEVLDQWRRRGDPVQAVRQVLARKGLLAEPPPHIPNPPTPESPPGRVCNKYKDRMVAKID